MTSLQSLLARFRKSANSSRRRTNPRTQSHGTASTEQLEQRLLLVNPVSFNSLPPGEAAVNLYLDFDGHTETDSDWTLQRRDGVVGSIVTPAFSVDGDATFNNDEIDRITEIYERVAEDFRPFNINVTTVEPADFDNAEDILISVGGDGAWLTDTNAADPPPIPRYVALRDSFRTAALPQSAFVIQTQHNGLGGTFEQNLAASISQAAAVMFGLEVHEDAADAPLEGDADVAPILGDQILGDDADLTNPNSVRDIWFNAPGSDFNNFQNDLQLIAGNPTVAFRADDHGDTDGASTGITVGLGQETATGFIGTNTNGDADVDVFSFTTAATNATISVSGLDLTGQFGTGRTPGSNLDPVLRLARRRRTGTCD